MTTHLDTIGQHRNIQPIFPNPTAPSDLGPLSIGGSLGLSPLSSIAPVGTREPVNYVPLRPELAPARVESNDQTQKDKEVLLDFLKQSQNIAKSDEPSRIKQAYLSIVLELHTLVEDVAASHVAHISNQIREKSAELEQLNLKKTEEIRKHVLEVAKDSTWSFLSNIFQYFLSATTLVLGSVLVATGVGATAGAFLIAAGGLGLLNRIAKDTDAYVTIISYFTKSQELQQSISNWVSTTILLATIGLGVTGGFMSAASTGLDIARNSLSAIDTVKKAETAIGLATACVAVGKANSDNQTAQVQKYLQRIEGHIFLMKKDLERWGSEAKNTVQMLQNITTETKQAINAFANK